MAYRLELALKLIDRRLGSSELLVHRVVFGLRFGGLV
jgi:hypothetical protein